MMGTLVSLIDFLTARDRCPCCAAARAEPPKGQPAQWHAHRIAFTCGASFVALGEAIRCEVACPDRSRLAAALWTQESGRPAFADGMQADDGALRIRLLSQELATLANTHDVSPDVAAAFLKVMMIDLRTSEAKPEGDADA